MDSLTQIVSQIETFMYGGWFVVLLLGTGLLLSVRTRFIQFRKFGETWRMTFSGAMGRDDSRDRTGDISPFQALTTALAATVGMGNIAGVATALFLGGPGAIFWMWLTAFCGMATIYSEATLAIRFRTVAGDGSMAGGPMYYISKGLGHLRLGRPLAVIFAVNGAIASFFCTGNMMQSNSIALIFKSSFGVSPWITGIGLALLTGLVTIGGIRRIGMVAEKLVPFMIVLYICGSLLILLLNVHAIPATLWLIVKSAFTPMAPLGGFAGAGVAQAMRYGVSRGILSNEAGMGTSPIAHGAAREEDANRQGIIAMNGVFIDTIIVCTMTALVILVTGVLSSGKTSTDLTAAAFTSVIPRGYLIVAFSSLLFGFSTLLGYSYYGEQCFEFLLGLRIVKLYRYVFVFLVFCGAVIRLELVWSLGTIANALMALPNLIGLIGLSAVVGAIARERPR